MLHTLLSQVSLSKILQVTWAKISTIAYTGDASGHFGDSIQYVTDTGDIKTISGASSTFGCSHNTGIALEAADAPPFASVCAEDHG